MIVGIGNDIIEIDRIHNAIQRTPRFITKNFTEKEIEYFKSKKYSIQSIAGNFAAKEAVSKALGTGFRTFELIDIEVVRDELGAPIVFLYSKAEEIRQQKNIDHIWISISHCRAYATAYAVAERIS